MKLGREIKLDSNTKLTESPSKIEFVEKHYEVLIGIGKDSTASLFLSESALQDLNEYKNNLTVDQCKD